MATTTNYAWETPDDTDLVKDGAAAIRTLGSSIDTTTKALNPSTTLGDIEYRSSTANTNTRLGIGTTGQVLTVTGGVPAWAAPAPGGGMTLIASGSAAGSATTVSITSIPATYKDLYLIVRNFRTSVDGRAVAIRFNGDSATRYAYSNSDFQINGTFNASSIVFGSAFDDTVTTGLTSLTIPDYTNTTTWKMLQGLTMGADNGTPTNCKAAISFGAYNQTGAISQVDITSTSGNITCNYLLYGVN